MNDPNLIVLHTGLYSDAAHAALAAMCSLICADGKLASRVITSTNVRREVDNEVVLVGIRTYSKLWNKPACEVRRYFAQHGKASACSVLGASCWNRANSNPMLVHDRFVPTAGKAVFVKAIPRDMHFIYDSFLGHKGLDRKYPAEYVKEFVGKPRDPVAVELELSRCAMIDEITKTYEDQALQVTLKYHKMHTYLDSQEKAELEQLEKTRTARIKEINESRDINSLSTQMEVSYQVK